MRGKRQKNNHKYANIGVKKGNLKQKARKAIKRSVEIHEDKDYLDWYNYASGRNIPPGATYIEETGLVILPGYLNFRELNSKPFCSVCGYIYRNGNTEAECFCERHGWFK